SIVQQRQEKRRLFHGVGSVGDDNPGDFRTCAFGVYRVMDGQQIGKREMLRVDVLVVFGGDSGGQPEAPQHLLCRIRNNRQTSLCTGGNGATGPDHVYVAHEAIVERFGYKMSPETYTQCPFSRTTSERSCRKSRLPSAVRK